MQKKGLRKRMNLTDDEIDTLGEILIQATDELIASAEKVALLKKLMPDNGSDEKGSRYENDEVDEDEIPNGFTPLLIPNDSLSEAGIDTGDSLSFSSEPGLIIITPLDSDEE